MKVKENSDITKYASDMILKHLEENKYYHSDYVFEVLYKRDFETEFTKAYELCEFYYDGEMQDWDLYWHTDWYIGENEVIFNKVVPLSEILDFYFERKDE